ncbi:unnamed protein product [Blepharisma stoltei]|uniref:PA14 domain-containing protein n=1 Tax=Blepharisma stoltei TaxID=1481888 RepID=A0AAU9JIT3_9CILI|nr:unnamed protein product [Blepharisma stoltei]
MIFLLLSLAAASLIKPNPVKWQSYDKSSNTLTIQWNAYSGGSSPIYYVSYTHSGTTYSLSSTSSTSATIQCSSTDGSFLDVYYQVTVTSGTSPTSDSVSMMCAGTPADVVNLSYSASLNTVTVAWSANGISNGGTPILGFNVYKKTSSWALLSAISSPTTFSYVDTVSYSTQYYYKVTAYNWVGESPGDNSISVLISQVSDPSKSTTTYPSSPSALYSFTVEVNMKDSSGNTVTSPSTFLLEVRDVCEVNNGYECIRVSSTNANYVADLMDGFDYSSFTDNGDGTMSASYTPQLAGPYTVSVIQLQQYGILGNYWDNAWWYSSLDSSQIDKTLSFSWSSDEFITSYASNFVSVKWFGFILPLYSETYTFYVLADDYAQLYIDGILVVDASSICCREYNGNAALTANSYAFIQINYKQLEGNANIWVGWSSYSQTKETIPSSKLYSPTRVSGSLYTLEVGVGLSSPSLCYSTTISSTTVGVSNQLSLYSVDANGNLLDNPTDVYSLSFSGPATVNFNSVYGSAGKSTATFILTKSGTYTATITLYGTSIKTSPFQLTVNPGSASTDTSTSSLSTLASSSLTAGTVYTITFNPLDAYSNSITSSVSGINLVINFIDNNSYQSSLGVSQPSNWTTVYGTNYSGTFSGTSITFVIYRAGNYQGYVYINQAILSGYPLSLSIIPSSIYAPYCVGVFSTTQGTAGTQFAFSLQTRDLYYNNLVITSISSYTLTAVGPSTASGSLVNTGSGTFDATFTINTSGTYTLSLLINSLYVPNLSSITISPASSTSSTTSSFTLSSTSVTAGTTITGTIYARDQYSNIRTSSSDTFTISILGNTGASVSSSIANNNDGTYTFTFVPTVADTYTVTVELSSSSLSSSGSTVTVSISLISALQSTFSSYSSQEAGTAYLYIAPKDKYSNSITSIPSSLGAQYFYANIQGSPNTQIKAAYENFTKLKVDLSFLTVSGDYSILLTLVQQGGLIGFYYKDQAFTSLQSNNPYYNFNGASPQNYTAVDSQINFDWKNSGPSYFSTAIINLFSVKWIGRIYTAATETFTFYVTCDYQAKLVINSQTLLNSIGSTVTNVQSGSISLVYGTFYDIELDYIAGSGSEVYIKLEWESTSITRQVVPSNYLFSDLNSASNPYSLTINPASTRASSCKVLSYPGDSSGISNAKSQVAKNFRIEARDRYRNLQTTATDAFYGIVTTGSSPISCTFSADSAGLYKGTFTASPAGSYTLYVYLQVSSVNYFIYSTSVTVIPGNTDPAKTKVTGISNTIAGQEGSFLVTAYDSAGNHITSGLDTVTVTISSSQNTVPSSQIHATDNSDGTYSVTYMIYIADTYTISTSMNGVSASTSSTTVTHTDLSIKDSTISAPSTATLNKVLSVDIYLNDIYGNAVNQTQIWYVYMTKEDNPNFNPLFFDVTTTSLIDGHFTASKNFSQDAVDKSGACYSSTPPSDSTWCDFSGDLSFYAFILTSGVYGEYYDTIDFSGRPLESIVDSSINFDWTSQTTVQGISTSNLGVIWSGFLLPSTSEQYTFTLTAQDWSSVYISNQKEVDTSSSSTFQYTFTKDFYYAFKLEYYCSSGSAKMQIHWSSTTIADVAIPSSAYYHYQDNIPIGSSAVVITGD